MSEKNIFQQMFSTLVEDRANKEVLHKALENPIYLKVQDESSGLLKLLREKLTTDEQRILLDKLESLWNSEEDILREYAYRQGIQDSVMLHHELQEFGFSVARIDD